MELYNVQLRTDLDEVVVLQVYAGDPMEAEFTAKSMVERGQAGTISNVTNGASRSYTQKVDTVLHRIYFFLFLSKPSSCARNIFRIGRRCHSLAWHQG